MGNDATINAVELVVSSVLRAATCDVILVITGHRIVDPIVQMSALGNMYHELLIEKLNVPVDKRESFLAGLADIFGHIRVGTDAVKNNSKFEHINVIRDPLRRIPEGIMHVVTANQSEEPDIQHKNIEALVYDISFRFMNELKSLT